MPEIPDAFVWGYLSGVSMALLIYWLTRGLRDEQGE